MKLTRIDDLISISFKWILVSFWLFGTFYVIGSNLEQTYGKVRIDQKVENVEYDQQKGYFCWDWYSTKVRKKPATTMGVVLKDQSNPDGVLLTTFNRYTLTPWQLGNPVPTARVNQPLCAFIPPGFKPKPPFTVSQYVVYPGFMNFWSLTTNLPTIKYGEITPPLSVSDEKDKK